MVGNMTSPPLDYESIFGRRMRQRREELGISTRSFAEMMRANGHDWHHATVQRTESAQRPVRLNETVTIVQLLDAPLALLVRPESDPGDIEAIQEMLTAAEARANDAEDAYLRAKEIAATASRAVDAARADLDRAMHDQDLAARAMYREKDRVTYLHDQLDDALRVVPARAVMHAKAARPAAESSTGED